MLDVKGKRVAVVGNASNVKGINQGKNIDNHDIVIRINLWQPKEEEKVDIGSRTDLFYIGQWIWTDLDTFKPFKHEFGTKRTVNGIPCVEKDQYVMRDLDCGLTGAICLYDCIESGCSQLSIYGFDSLETPDRYSGENKNNLPETELEAYRKSRVLISRLLEKPNVFIYPTPKPVIRETFLSPYIKGKSVSIVGAALSIFENGNKNGQEIDSREVVIRSNMIAPLNEQDYPYVGKRTDVIYCNNYNYLNLTEDGLLLGVPAVVQPFNDYHISNEIIKKYGSLLVDKKSWCPMSGLCCIYTACVSGAKEIYVSGFDFYRSNNRQDSQMVKTGERECFLGGGNWNNTLKDELAFKEFCKVFPIKLDKVLDGIVNA